MSCVKRIRCRESRPLSFVSLVFFVLFFCFFKAASLLDLQSHNLPRRLNEPGQNQSVLGAGFCSVSLFFRARLLGKVPPSGLKQMLQGDGRLKTPADNQRKSTALTSNLRRCVKSRGPRRGGSIFFSPEWDETRWSGREICQREEASRRAPLAP